MKSVTPNSVNLYEICERLNDIWWILGWKSASVEDNFKPCWERPTRLNSTQLNSTEIAQFAESWKFSEVVELSWVETCAPNTPKTHQNWLWPSLQLLTNSSLRRLGISSVTYILINMAARRKKALALIICPIAIAYSMGQIIKSVCVCQSVSVSVCEHSHCRILGLFLPKFTQT